MLQLDAVGQNQWHVRCKVRLDHDTVVLHFTPHQRKDVTDHGVDIEPVLVRGRFLGEGANPIYSLLETNTIGYKGHGAPATCRLAPRRSGHAAHHTKISEYTPCLVEERPLFGDI